MKVHIISNDTELLEAIILAFKVGWPKTSILSSNLGSQGLEILEKEIPDIIILDLVLPDTSGFNVLKNIRLFSSVPVVIVTARAEESDIVKSLELGADECIVAPFGQMELLARVKMVKRRSVSPVLNANINHNEVFIDIKNAQLTINQRSLHLTHTECLIMQCLIEKLGQVVDFVELSEVLWGEDYPKAADNLRVYIRRLRAKLKTVWIDSTLIFSKPGVGYYLSLPR
ncbi:response regulator transcription factor [Dehalococcoides mccartyi]|uniref:DNA-binding response regulator n=1 Tax=Dehalococcoides mccartyi (strain VS) TaxID=311424 RepID=D2BG09_DEHMV|nr:response regulator transcription factor [Dehalococcoides mccartyi]ACZ61259.1 DNA-binding response regulator [Dehalococcoides mccartyi VS]